MAEATPKTTQANGRKQWDKSEWEAKAKAKDEMNVERAKAAEEAIKQGKKPRFDNKPDVPKPTKKLEARTEDLGLEKNLNKTVLVQTTTTGKGPRGAGFYCDLCNRTLKDSLSYLDHVNSRFHLRMLGQTTQVSRSTLSQVRARIAQLRAESEKRVTASNYDFKTRLAEVRRVEGEEREKRKGERKRRRAERRGEVYLGDLGGAVKVKVEGESPGGGGVEEVDMQAMMGFGGFGGAKKGRS